MTDLPNLSPALAAFDPAQRASISQTAEAVRYNQFARRQFLWGYAARTTAKSGSWSGTHNRPYIAFADAATNNAGWWCGLPYSMHGRPLALRFYWTQSGTATGNFRCDISVQVRAAGEVLTAGSAWIAETFDLAAPGVANQLVITELAPSPVGPAAVIDEDTITSILFRRLGADAADTCTDELRLAGIEISCL